MFRTLDDLPSDRRLLCRLDLNSPVEDGVVQDNKRFERHAKTVGELVDAGHRIAILAHQGRPNRPSFLSLEQHADILASHLDSPIQFVDDVYGERALSAIDSLDSGEVLVLENVRSVPEELEDHTPEEHANCPLVRILSAHVDAYVNDAYSTAHRAHASTVGFPVVLDAYAGRVMESEYLANSAIQSRTFDGPVTMVLGGIKVEDLIAVLTKVEDRVDTVCLGGVIAELFLRDAGHDLGYDVGSSDLFDDQWETNRELIASIRERAAVDLCMPIDLAYRGNGDRQEISVDGISKTTPFYDVGTQTVDQYGSVIKESAAVFVKGALGKFEDEAFSYGTVELLRTIAETDAFSVIGGGDTAWAIDRYGLDESAFSHVSIAGGAYVRALAGERLPAIDALQAATDQSDNH